MNFTYHGQFGLSLIELMLAMVIGLFLIGGVGTVFISNQTTSIVKQDLDRTQENFRFGSNTLQRVVRQADGINADSTASELSVSLPTGSHNCIGGQVMAVSQTNDFFVNADSELVCTINDGAEEVLLSGITDLSFTYGAGNPEDSSSVQVMLTVLGQQAGADQNISFLIALRAKLIADFGGSSGGSMPPTEPPAPTDPPPTDPPPTDPPPTDPAPTDPAPTDPPPTDPAPTDPPPTDPPPTYVEPVKFSCICGYKNKSGWSVQAGSNSQCTAACCAENAPQIKNNESVKIEVSSC